MLGLRRCSPPPAPAMRFELRYRPAAAAGARAARPGGGARRAPGFEATDRRGTAVLHVACELCYNFTLEEGV